MKSFTLTITEEDLKKAEKSAIAKDNYIVCRCVVAQAFKRFCKEDFTVGYSNIYIGNSQYICTEPEKMENITRNSYTDMLTRGLTRKHITPLLPCELTFELVSES